MKLAHLLSDLLIRNSSQLHLVVDESPIFRVDGALARGDFEKVTESDIEDMLIRDLSDRQREHFHHRGYTETTLRHENHLFYCHVARERGRAMAAIAALPTNVGPLEELVENEEDLGRLLRVLQFRKGVVFVTGAAGSGKSTLCAAMIESINRTQAKRIVTIESPIEHDLVNKQSVITQQMIGSDFESFSDAIASAKGSYADIVYISELRDFRSFELAFDLADTGQLVITTWSQPTASNCIKQMNDAFPENRERVRELMIGGIQAVVATQLVPRVGSRDRIGAYEILIATVRVRGIIQEGKWDFLNILRQERAIGMQPMDDSLLRLLNAKKITFDEARHRVLQKDAIPPHV